MKLIVGLGNPGMQYAATRHNIGFEVIDSLSEVYNIPVNKSKYKALIGEGRIGYERVILMKPQTFMNLSGESVRACMDFQKLSNEDVIIIYDDISLDVGQIRIRKSGSAGGHNGIKSIIAHMNTQEFPRVKVGVGQKPAGWDLAKKAYLSNFDSNWKGFMAITEIDIDKFKKWLYAGMKQRKPFSEYVDIKNR